MFHHIELEIYTCPKTGHEFIMSPAPPVWPLVIICFICCTSTLWLALILNLLLKNF